MESNAINPNFSAWVNASAGTGKTKILIDRVLRLLLESKKNIICLTFTNAAANEMEDRIYNTLSKWAICQESILVADLEQLVQYMTKKNNDYLTRARRLFSELENLNLNIQTIHAFCYKLVSRFPIEAGISPNCTLSECKELHSIAFQKTLHSKTVQGDISIVAAEIDENKLYDLLYTLCIKRSVLKNNLGYIKDKLNVPDKIFNLESETIKQLRSVAKILGNGSKRDQNYSTILYDWYNSTKSSLSNIIIPVLDTEEIQENRDMDHNVKHWNDNKIKSLAKVFLKPESYEKKSISSIVTKGVLKKFNDLEQMIENIQDKLSIHVKNVNSYQIFKRTNSLLNIFKVYLDLYNSEKSKNSLLDYDDVISLSANLLSKRNNKRRILFNPDQKINHIVIDEAQDNSINQWKIIKGLCNEFFTGNDEKRTLFVVGDVKQSIYRFQGANPCLFNYMQQHFYRKNCGRNWVSCKLEKSFRSTPEILMLVDRIFNNFREEISLSDNKIKHIPYREKDQGYIEIWPLLPEHQKKKQHALQIHLTERNNYVVKDRLLAQAIAKKIHNWLNEGRILVAKDRNIEPNDIMILTRQRNVLFDYIISELKKINVPIIGRDYFRIMDYIAVQDLIALAEFLLLQKNDLALANVLRSPLFNFTDDDLFNIAYNRKEQSLWEKIRDYHEVIYSELNYLINLSQTESHLTLFTHILSTGKKKFAARLGLECFEILDEFINLALQFEHLSLQAFIQWIKENNPEIKNDMQSELNAVRIMTIHKSKGLQAPIVFLVDTNTIPRNSENILFDVKEAPFWCGENSNTYCTQIKKKKKLEDYNEYLRLLYVALTRAEDELYILGKEPIQKGSWYDIVIKYGALYEKKKLYLRPMFKKQVEVLCINASYPFIYKKHDYSNIPVILPPSNLSISLRHLTLESKEKKNDQITTSKTKVIDENTRTIKKRSIEITNSHARGSIIHNILQYIPKIEKGRRKNWIREYLDNVNTNEDKNEIYTKILTFSEKYDYMFDLEGKSEVPLSGTIDGKPVLVRLDRLCITKNKVIIIDYKSRHKASIFSSNKIKKQMLIYKTLVQEIYPDKMVECLVISTEDLTLQSL